MSHWGRIFTAMCCSVLLVSAWLEAAPSTPVSAPVSIASSDPETIALGRQLFERNCSVCHGHGAVGENAKFPQGGIKPGGEIRAPALNGSGHAWHHPPEYFFRTIREGSIVPGSRMKGWVGRMNEYEIVAVIAYFQSLWPKAIKEGYLQQYLYQVKR